ncbi:aminotransferase class I/II-fold pyridoxal phosphate-dependent enzyme [Candidatus Woesearchaeota archaeon]|nr:aminotransferase class I/II-fold pyridoxal phosphate-dependent enzyme [Candidatus Woesearchaeota archaeon]
MNPQAEALNKSLPSHVTALLSAKGKAAFWPKLGILQQCADARGKAIDATIGIAVEDDKEPMRLSATDKLPLPPKAVYPYAPGFGVKELRELWKAEMLKKNPSLKAPASLPVVTAGLTHGLSILGSLFLDPGDEIVLPDMFWGNYKLIFEHIHGAKLTSFPTFIDGGFNLKGLEESLKGKKVLLLNFPNNPTGYTPTEEEADGIITIIKNAAKENPLLVILDDAYFGLVYEDGIEKESLFAKLAGLDNVLAVKVDGATKEEFAWGFRIGFLTYNLDTAAAQALEEKTAGTIRATVSNCNHAGQSLMVQALKDSKHEEEKEQKFNTLKARYEKVKEVLKDSKLSPLPFNSGYFMCLKLEKDSEAVRQALLKDGVGVIALANNLIRVAYSGVAEQDIPELFKKIERQTNI